MSTSEDPTVLNGDRRGNAVFVVVQPTKTSDEEHFNKNLHNRLINALSAGQLIIFAIVLI